MSNRKFVCYFHFNGWSNVSLGFSISFIQPNIEIHVPFGFFRIGFTADIYYYKNRFETDTHGIGV